jgi:hypothetical protein
MEPKQSSNKNIPFPHSFFAISVRDKKCHAKAWNKAAAAAGAAWRNSPSLVICLPHCSLFVVVFTPLRRLDIF